MEVATGPSSGSHLTGGRLRNPGGRPRNSRKTHRSSLRRIIPAAQPGAPATRHLDFPYAPEPPILVDVPGSGGPHTRDKSNWRPPSQQPPSQGDTLTGFAPCLVSTEIHGGLDDILEPISPPPSSQSTQDNDSTASQSPAPLWSPSAAWTSSSRGNRSSRHTARARQAQMSSSKPRRCYPYDITEKDTGSAYRWIELDVLGCDNSRRQVKAIIDPHTKRNLIRGRVVHELNYCPLPIAPKDSRPLLSRLVGLVQPNTFLEVVVQATTNPVLIRSLPMYVFDEREDTEAKGDWDIILKEPLKDAMAGERGDGQHLEQVTVDSLPYGITWGCGAATARTSTSDYMDAPSDHEMPTSQFVPSSFEHDVWSHGPSGPTALTIPESLSASFGVSPYGFRPSEDGILGALPDLEPSPFDLSTGDSSLFRYVDQDFASGDALPLQTSDVPELPMASPDATNSGDLYAEYAEFD